MKMFANKQWTLGGLKTLIKKLTVAAPWNVAMEAVNRAVRDDDNIDDVITGKECIMYISKHDGNSC